MTAPPRTKVTMHDVAKLAGVSQSTVSRVLNGSAAGIPIGEETRQRVLEAVRTLGYYPNLNAGSLRGQKTLMLAMMIADIANPFYHAMVRAVQDVAHAHRYDVMIANSDHERDNELLFMESIIRRPVDGVFLVPYHLTREHLSTIIARTGSAVVAVGQHVDHPLVDTAHGDDYQAVIDTVTWLHRERGHRRIGFIGVTQVHSAGARRRAAFEAVLQRLALPDPPTAVFAINDLMAIGALEAARAAQMCIPEEIAVVGFDDIPAASWVRPRLTTVAQYPADMGRILTEALFARIEGAVEGAGRRFAVPCKLVVREST